METNTYRGIDDACTLLVAVASVVEDHSGGLCALVGILLAMILIGMSAPMRWYV